MKVKEKSSIEKSRLKYLFFGGFVGAIIGLLTVVIPLHDKKDFQITIDVVWIVLGNVVTLGFFFALTLGHSLYYRMVKKVDRWTIRGRILPWGILAIIIFTMASYFGFFNIIE